MRILLFVLFLSVFQIKLSNAVFAQSSWQEAEKQRKKDEKQRKKLLKNQEKSASKGVGVQKWDNKFDKKPPHRKRGVDTQKGKNNPDSANKKPKTKKKKFSKDKTKHKK